MYYPNYFKKLVHDSVYELLWWPNSDNTYKGTCLALVRYLFDRYFRAGNHKDRDEVLELLMIAQAVPYPPTCGEPKTVEELRAAVKETVCHLGWIAGELSAGSATREQVNWAKAFCAAMETQMLGDWEREDRRRVAA